MQKPRQHCYGGVKQIQGIILPTGVGTKVALIKCCVCASNLIYRGMVSIFLSFKANQDTFLTTSATARNTSHFVKV